MKLLFAHDHKLKKYNNEYYTTGGFSDEVTRRYTDVFDNMTLICRCIQTDDISGLVKVENEKLTIVPIYTNKLFPKKEIIEIIKRELSSTDRVIVRLPSILGIYVAKLAFKKKIKLCVEIVGSTLGSYWYKNILGKIVALPLYFINRNITKKADYALYVSNDYLQKEYPNGNSTIGCSDVILEKRNRLVFEKRIAKINSMVSDKKLIFGTLSQVDQKYKGHKTVFEMISKLKEKGYDIEYRLAGSGDKKYLQDLAARYHICDSIKFFGQIKHQDINNWIDELDVYIQPSLTEGMPRSVIEALNRACPIIVSSAGGMYELVEKEYIFKKGNSNELQEKVTSLSKEKLLKMAKRNFEFSAEFDSEFLNAKRREFYDRFKAGV